MSQLLDPPAASDAAEVSPEELLHPESVGGLRSAHPGATLPSGVGGLWSATRRALTVGLVLTITLVAFEALAVSTIMPIVARELGGLQLYGWVFTAFFLGSLIGIVVVGGIIDRRGLAGPFVVGLVLFGVGLIVGGLTPSMGILVGARFIQGVGAGSIPPIAYVAIARSLPDVLRAPMFATLSTAWVLPGVIGPAIAGLVAEHTTWRAVFLGLVPLILISGGMTFSSLRRIGGPVGREESAGAAGAGTGRIWNALWVAAGAALITGGLTNGSAVHIASLSLDARLASAALAVAGLTLLLPAFRRLTPPGTLAARRGLPAAVLLRGILTFAFFGVDAFVAFTLVEWRGLSAAGAGIALTTATVSWTAGSWVQARGAIRLGNAWFVRLGFATLLVGLAAFALVLIPTVPVWVAIPTFGVAGLGMGLAYAPLSLIVLRDARAGEQGAATAALSLSDALGTALGTGIAGSIVAAGLRSGADPGGAVAPAFAVAASIAALGLLLSPRLRANLAQGDLTNDPVTSLRSHVAKQ
jgi:MFS family permease